MTRELREGFAAFGIEGVTLQQLEAALAAGSLTERQAEAFRLRYLTIGCDTNAEVGRRMGINRAPAGALIDRAWVKLADHLEGRA